MGRIKLTRDRKWLVIDNAVYQISEIERIGIDYDSRCITIDTKEDEFEEDFKTSTECSNAFKEILDCLSNSLVN